MLTIQRPTMLRTVMVGIVCSVCAQIVEGGPWRSQRLHVNGVPLAVQTAELDADRAGLARALMARWQAPGGAAPQLVSTVSQTLIGRQRGRLHETVTLSDVEGGRTRVLIVVADLGRAARPMPRPSIVPPTNAKLLQVVEQGDGDSATRTFSFASDGAPQAALSRWRRALVAEGWDLRISSPHGDVSRGWVLWADRGRERMEAVLVVGASGSRVVLNEHRHAR